MLIPLDISGITQHVAIKVPHEPPVAKSKLQYATLLLSAPLAPTSYIVCS